MSKDSENIQLHEPRLLQTEKGLALTDGNLMLIGDFTDSIKRLKSSSLENEMLVKASKLKEIRSPLVVDATAGMGEDSLLLAASGCRVILFEQDEIIASLLADTIKRSKSIPELANIVGRMEVRNEDSIEALKSGALNPDIVYLDPMFPKRQKSGLIKKKFQLLQQLEAPCVNENELMEAAIASKPKKIVVKRPAKGPNLAGKKPSYVVDGKVVRYDCYINLT